MLVQITITPALAFCTLLGLAMMLLFTANYKVPPAYVIVPFLLSGAVLLALMIENWFALLGPIFGFIAWFASVHRYRTNRKASQ